MKNDGKSAGLDWQGLDVPADETPDTLITVWEIDPSLADQGYDCVVIRDYHKMLDYVENSLDLWLDNYTEAELREHGARMTFKLRTIAKFDYEICQEREP